MILWDCEEASKSLEDGEAYLEVRNDPGAFVSTVFKSLKRKRKSGALSQDRLNYFLAKEWSVMTRDQWFLTAIFTLKIFLYS